MRKISYKGGRLMQKKKAETKSDSETTVKVPIVNIRMMTDDEWNALAYKNYLERQVVLE